MKRLPVRATLLFFAVAFAIIVPFCIWGGAIEAWFDGQMKLASAHPERTALVLFGLLATAIVLPVPSSLVSTCCGLTLGFPVGFLISFMAMNVSAGLGYLLGRFGARYAANLIGVRDQKILESFARNGAKWLLLLLRPVPVLAEASVLFSGIARQPIKRAAGEVLLGNVIVSAVYVAVGTWGKTADSMLLALGATLVVAGICLVVGRKQRRL